MKNDGFKSYFNIKQVIEARLPGIQNILPGVQISNENNFYFLLRVIEESTAVE